MSGHNKWSQIKRKKAINDNRRGANISKHLAAIQAAVTSGGSGDPAGNLALKNTIAAAKTDGVPSDNVNRAIERAVGAGEGGGLEEAVYEGYAPAGAALLVYTLSDNRNRTAAEVRHTFVKHGGNMSGGVAWMFKRRGLIVLPTDSEAAQELTIEVGAEDFEASDGVLVVYTAFEDLYSIAEAFRAKGFEPETAEFASVADTMLDLNPDDAAKVARIVEALEDLDDVQKVFTNANLDEAQVNA